MLLSTVLIAAACSEPPRKELDRAQGAIDTARAAGAERYAQDTFTTATTALREAYDAVEQRDYRLALTRALDANEQAQEAARLAADGKAAARSASETALAAAAALLDRLEARISIAEAARVPAKDIKPSRTARAGRNGPARSTRADCRREIPEASNVLQAARDGIEAQIRRSMR